MSELGIRQEVRLVGKHSAIYGVGQALSRAVGFFLLPLYTHYLMPSDYGSLELVEVVSNLVGLLLALGVSSAMPQFYYAEKDQRRRNQVVTTILVGFALFGLPIVLATVLFARPLARLLFESTDFALPLTLTIGATWFGSQCQVGYTYLRMRYMAKTFVAITTGQLIIAVFLTILFVVYLRMGFVGICYSTLIHQSITGIALTVGILRRVYERPSTALLRRLVLFGLPLVPLRLASDVGTTANRFCLRYLASPDPVVGLSLVGLFSLANKLAVITNRFVNVPFNNLWVPRCRELLYIDEQEARHVMARICTYSTFVAAFVALLIAAGAENVIHIMAAASYGGAHIAVPLLALAFVVLGMDNHFMIGMTYKNKTSWGLIIGVVTLGVILLTSFVLVPHLGLVGAAIAHLTAYTSRSWILYMVSQRAFRIPFEVRRIVTMLVVAVVLYLCAQSISTGSVYLTLFSRLTVAGLFPLALLPIGFYHKDELSAARDFSSRAFRNVITWSRIIVGAEGKGQP